MDRERTFIVYGINPDGKPLTSGKFTASAALITLRAYRAMGGESSSRVVEHSSDGSVREISESELEKLVSEEG